MGLETTVAVVVLCLFFQAFFAGSEMALISCDKIKMKVLAGRGSRSASLVLKSHSEVERFLSTTLAGINLSLITSTILLTFYMESRFGGGEYYAVVILSPLVVVFGQVVPKSIFRRRSDSAILWMIYPLWAATRLFLPLTWVVSFFTRCVLRFTGRRSSVTRGEITDSIKAHKRGSQDAEKRQMLGRIFSFSKVTVGEVMIPLSSVKALDRSATVSEATELVRNSGHTRIPLYSGRIDNITGVLHSFFLLDSSPNRSETGVGSYSSPAFYVPERKPINELLDEMKAGTGIAIVVNENGGAVGIVTLEDILEQIVGEIEDEHDRGGHLWTRVGAAEYLVSPQVEVKRANEELGLSIPESENYETVGGFLLSEFGHIPSEGEMLESGNLIFTVESATSRSIQRVKIVSTG